MEAVRFTEELRDKISLFDGVHATERKNPPPYQLKQDCFRCGYDVKIGEMVFLTAWTPSAVLNEKIHERNIPSHYIQYQLIHPHCVLSMATHQISNTYMGQEYCDEFGVEA
jgi:hypothetical protein